MSKASHTSYNYLNSASNWYRIFLPQTEAHLDTLISEQASFILGRSGVGSLYTVFLENRNQKVDFILFLCARKRYLLQLL